MQENNNLDKKPDDDEYVDTNTGEILSEKEIEFLEAEEFNEDENFETVFQLTKFAENGDLSNRHGGVSNEDNQFVVAEYKNIEITKVTKNQAKVAKKFVQEAERLIVSYGNKDGGEFGGTLKNYINSITTLQLGQLTDLLTLVEVNKQMLGNMVRRINTFQADDYALIQTYTQLLQQHIKLHRETQNTFGSIPAMLKKMVVDISEDLLDPRSPNEAIIGENHGITQFNNSKDMLKKIKEKQNEKNNKLRENGNNLE